MKGQKISDRYQIIKNIGEGGMANVYLAYDTILDRNVAVKVLRGDLANDEKFVRRFQREALSASSLSNPNIVEVYDVGEDNGEYYIVMEYIEGKQLKTLLKKRGRLTVSEAVDIVSQITDGLSVAHDSYIIHRDIKPQNIMILENGLVKITDFGIAMAMNSTQLTQTNSVMGSVHYIPPEQASGKGSTLQSDIYSIGILFYELLTGNLPFKGDNAVEIALKHLKEPLPSIRDNLPNVPQSVENIIIKATAKNPKNRYADSREMHEDLMTCLSKERENEPKIKLKYQELDDTKVIKTVKDEEEKNKNKKEKIDENKIKRNKNVKEKNIDNDDEANDLVAKKISGDDLKKQNKVLIVLAAIFTGLVLVVTLVFVYIMLINKTSTIEVPDVSKLTVNQAVKKLQNAGFKVADEEEGISSDIDTGLVVKTNPSAGKNRKKGTTIKIYVSTGDATIKIEDYTGMNYLEVKGNLSARGITVNIEEESVTDGENKIKSGDVVRQSIEPGEFLESGDTITLYVANVGEVYPDFTDGHYTVEDVETFCDEHNLKCDYIKTESSTELDGTIYKQSRTPGSEVKEKAPFKIYYYVSVGDETEPDDGGDDTTECSDEDRALGIC